MSSPHDAIDTAEDTTLILGTGTRRRIQGCFAAGYTTEFLESRLPTSPCTATLLTGIWVTARTARAVRALSEELATCHPEDFGISEIGSKRARQRAERNGWLTLDRWSPDSIDKPRGKPRKPDPRGTEVAAQLENLAFVLATTRIDPTDSLMRATLRERLGVDEPRLHYLIGRRRELAGKVAA